MLYSEEQREEIVLQERVSGLVRPSLASAPSVVPQAHRAISCLVYSQVDDIFSLEYCWGRAGHYVSVGLKHFLCVVNGSIR
jgi:hypothetical protein